jgi:hypothetical protein
LNRYEDQGFFQETRNLFWNYFGIEALGPGKPVRNRNPILLENKIRKNIFLA